MQSFADEFLEHYLQFGLGSMTKVDIDALVMHLIDKHGLNKPPSLAQYSNQAVSELLRTPVSKVKKLRYDAALKYGGRVEDQAKGRLLAALSKATIETDGETICMIIEDALAKNWLQGQLKNNQLVFDHSFNTEIVRVSAPGLFDVLDAVFDRAEVKLFRDAYDAFKKSYDQKTARKTFNGMVKKFAEGAAKSAGGAVFVVLKASLG